MRLACLAEGVAVGAVPGESPGRFAVLAEMEVVGIFLGPVETGLFTVDTEAEIVFVAYGYLAGPEHASRAALVAEEKLDVVVEATARDEGGDVGRYLLGA